MPINESDKTRILLKKGNNIYKLCNILSLRENNDKIYEYKFTFPLSKFSFLENIEFSSVHGVTRPHSKEELFNGKLEVCYHSGGKISYKIINNSGVSYHKKYYKSQALHKITKPNLFLRISSSHIKNFLKFNRTIRDIDYPLDMNDFDNAFSIDFHFASKEYKLVHHDIFKNAKQFTFEDADGMTLLLDCYKQTDIKGIYTVIIDKSLLAIIKNKLAYLKHKIKSKLKISLN